MTTEVFTNNRSNRTSKSSHNCFNIQELIKLKCQVLNKLTRILRSKSPNRRAFYHHKSCDFKTHFTQEQPNLTKQPKFNSNEPT